MENIFVSPLLTDFEESSMIVCQISCKDTIVATASSFDYLLTKCMKDNIQGRQLLSFVPPPVTAVGVSFNVARTVKLLIKEKRTFDTIHVIILSESKSRAIPVSSA